MSVRGDEADWLETKVTQITSRQSVNYEYETNQTKLSYVYFSEI